MWTFQTLKVIKKLCFLSLEFWIRCWTTQIISDTFIEQSGKCSHHEPILFGKTCLQCCTVLKVLVNITKQCTVNSQIVALLQGVLDLFKNRTL